ncbi:MAG: glycosyltransferase family 4 protein [Bacteroidales bacterium]
MHTKTLLLVWDEYVFSLDGKYYLRKTGHTLLDRYLMVFDSIIIASRTKIVYDISEFEDESIELNSTKVKILPIPFFQGPFEYSKVYFKVQKKFRSIVGKYDYALFRLPSTIAFVAAKYTIKRKIPFLVEVVANPHELYCQSNDILIKILMKLWDKHLKKACLSACGVSYVTEYTLQNRYPANKNAYKTNYSSVELKESFFYKQREGVADKNQFIISHVSNPIKTFNKGHLTVIRVVKKLIDKGYNVKAKFAGDGELVNYFYEEADKLGIKDNIEFVGLLNIDDLNSFLIESDIMVFPSSSEGLPRAILEAMATGLPCLSTPVGGIPEIIDSSLLFEPDNIDGFADKTLEILINNYLYEKISKTNFIKSNEYKSELLNQKRKDFYMFLKNN